MFGADGIFVSEKEVFAQLSPSLCLNSPLAPPSVHTPSPFPALCFSVASTQFNISYILRDGLYVGHCLTVHFRLAFQKQRNEG